jgi:hypothetical protein
MALNRPFGFFPLGSGDTNDFNSQLQTYRIPSSDGSQYSVQDAVVQVIGADTNGVPNVQKWTGTGNVRGIIVGIQIPTVVNPSLVGNPLQIFPTIPATKTQDYYVYVMDDPGIRFAVMDDGITTGNLIANNANKMCSATITNPTVSYQLSASVILSSSIATTNTLPIRLVGLVQQQAIVGGGSNGFGAFGIWVARWNLHDFAQGFTTGGTGV